MSELRKTGIEVMGEIPWGSHFCTFYETNQDLLDTIVPYFKTGLENKEFCLWVISDSGEISVSDAKEAMRQAIPDFDQHISKGNIEILDALDWYLHDNVFNFEKIINSWHVKLGQALALGYDGMRTSGDTFWLVEKYWKDFCTYERQLNNSVTELRIMVLCTYPLMKSGAAEVLDVVQTHQFAIARRKGEWEVIETAMLKKAQDEIKRLNKELQGSKIKIRRSFVTLNYLVSVLSVTGALFIARWLDIKMVTAPVSLFLCAIILSAWYGGLKPGLLAVVLSLLAFKYFFVEPLYSFNVEINSLPRYLVFVVAMIFVAILSAAQSNITESLRHARNVLEGTVQKLRATNAVLEKEVTVRKQAENTLRKSENNIRLIIDTIPIMAWSLEPDGILDFANKRWLDYVGEGGIEDPNRIIHPEDFQGAIEKWHLNMVAGRAYDDEMRLRRADREYRWFLVRTAPLHDEQGNIVKWYGVCFDIEDKKRAEDELRESEQQYLALFENMAEGVAYFQMLFKDDKLQDAIYLEMNPAWENLTGLKNVIGRKITEIIPGIMEANSEFIERSARVALTGQPERFESYSTYLKKWLSTSAYSPKKEHVIVVMDDITKRKQAEESLQQSYEEIKRLTEHLQNIREEERTHIAREIHDELGSQLTVLKMDVSWLKKKLSDAGETIKLKIRDLINMLDATVKSVRRISSELRPNLLDNLGLVAAMEWHLKEFEKRSGIESIFNEPEQELEIPKPIKNCLFRIFQESLTNVARHSEAKKVKVELLQKNDELILTIEDDGKGFDKQEVAEKKTLGILGMRERAVMMNGRYQINSIPEKGTTVTVVLPRKI